MKISQIAAIRLLIETKIKSPFISCNGYLKYNCQESLINGNKIICKLNALAINLKIVFGKGFENINGFV
jgi:hypothetical protein